MNAIIFIILIMVAFTIWRIRSERKELDRYPTDANGNPIVSALRESELQREIDQLRERVEVLERIVTEDREAKRLSAEIERLRDQPE